MDGEFDLPPESHGESIYVKWTDELGYTYDEKGNVAIGLNQPVSRDLTVTTTVLDKRAMPIEVDVYPAVCKIKL